MYCNHFRKEDNNGGILPPVSRLTKIACVRFAWTEKGIRGVRFDEREKKLYLPAITLHSNSEVVLRNLLVYEAASAKPGSTLELAEYVDLMCGIVDIVKDVEILREQKIMSKGDGDLTDKEIARIFNGIRKSTGRQRREGGEDRDRKSDRESERECMGIRRGYRRADSSRNIFRYRAWKFLGVISSVMLMIFLALQAFCLIYDCRSHWSMKSKYNTLRVL